MTNEIVVSTNIVDNAHMAAAAMIHDLGLLNAEFGSMVFAIQLGLFRDDKPYQLSMDDEEDNSFRCVYDGKVVIVKIEPE